MKKMDKETCRLVRELMAQFGHEPPDRLRRAFCDIIGAFMDHVITHARLSEDERQATLLPMLELIEKDIMNSYYAFINSPERLRQCHKCLTGKMQHRERVAEAPFPLFRYACDKCGFVECYADDTHQILQQGTVQ